MDLWRLFGVRQLGLNYNLMKKIVTCLLAILLLFSANVLAEENNSPLKPRLVVMTDIGDCDVEPDDMESAIRLMAYVC